ncbi:bifunctional 4-hydroxy-2-oxoglutarate aldolase/2-dehydro-3-deoxy-phosphogluconate aldolase [Streptacidiphilus sp. P02-A3a]|uniref:bifunctional 4-hydroxy-2-oxoglutarate aldolase/2-dehydro-3-deoxy-phosphogluconate aldolase n=1 Tax=Streptacidiphilus sp. P02-A3a TaxID=2704468 RepID=UPI0015FA687D|nr:bifunctional 4-hydroxy-2-oxoglutarate aldolase/2-dehydro-3-deoxy-phosphogluconate aldolase [Streptacidiphilus sp. P02-A3a]QMU70161.1 bifunctional 4-hydroxy-2-oxoglutarate aldolase/2-dehydro-3-deoxy-phosphogluconate aldolase [Streptacidiphilus sp. P02-A3a]QMU70389.1 bifunctional 4-hydroxy-2-oxoglutarate aldolase/2-dehydro-3-deoxy-phosphogluconate aldolase [Streptacidiphilus sp. P02-A3a]
MNLLAEIAERKVLAIIRADGPERALDCVRTLVGAGITALEVSLTTPGALEAIARARAQCPPSVLVGAGTVLTADQAEAAAEARAQFAVTPAITPGARRSVALGLPLLCGALTPTEVLTALDLGAAAVKIFPAGAHGPHYIRELLAPLPTAPLVAVGGVDATSAPRYLAAGARAVAVGSPLLGSAGRGGAQAELADRAAALLAAVGAAGAVPAGRDARRGPGR